MRIHRILLLAIIIPVLAGIALMSYYDSPDSKNMQERIPDKTITIGTIGINAVKQSKEFQSTADYLASKLSSDGITYAGKVVIAASVDEMQDKLSKQEIDLFFDSPLTAVIVSDASDSVPFLIRWKEQTPTYHTVFFVKTDSEINSLDDFTGKTIVFENPESSSGYFVPKSFLLENGFDLGNDAGNIKYVFSGEDENTPYFILEGRGHIGTMSHIDYNEDLDENIRSKFRIVNETGDMPRQIVSHRSNMNSQDVENIKEILLGMHNDPEGQLVLEEFSDTAKYQETSIHEEWFESMIKMKSILCSKGDLIAC